jgi:hypothetical protein
MNKDTTIALFNRCPHDSGLFDVAQVALKNLECATAVKVVVGEPMACCDLLKIYAARLKSKQAQGQHIGGLKETVESFSNTQGMLRGGYAQAESALIYFWTNETGNLVGCVLQFNRNHRDS